MTNIANLGRVLLPNATTVVSFFMGLIKKSFDEVKSSVESDDGIPHKIF
jgi:hypothetical protein